MESIAIDVDAAKLGDIKAFERLINQTRNMVTSIAFAIVKDVDASEEVAQQVYISCWQNLHTLKSNGSFLPWVRQSVRYSALNYLRDNKTNKRESSEQATIVIDALESGDLPPDSMLERLEQQQLVNIALESLSSESKEILLLYYREQQSTQQVARLLELREDNVRQKLARARAKIKTELLERLGTAILSTAPTVTFTSLTIGSVLNSPKAAATSAVASSSVTSKLSWLFSGAMLSAFFAAFVVYFSASLPLKTMSSEQRKQQLKRVRNKTVVWVLLSGVLLSLSYEFTSGGLGPIAAYTIFAAGLFKLMQLSQQLIIEDQDEHKTKAELHALRWQRLCAKVGLYAGILIGFTGLIIGLIGAGRL